jgi:hypothetical protein
MARGPAHAASHHHLDMNAVLRGHASRLLWRSREIIAGSLDARGYKNVSGSLTLCVISPAPAPSPSLTFLPLPVNL